jgi:hypothetical protein
MRAMHVSATTISAVVLLVVVHLPLTTALHAATHKADSRSSTISSGRWAQSHAAPRAGVVHAHAVTSEIAGTSTHDERAPVTPSANRKSGVSPSGPTPAGCDAHMASTTCMLLAKLKCSIPVTFFLSALLCPTHVCLQTTLVCPSFFDHPSKKDVRALHTATESLPHTYHTHTMRVFARAFITTT